MTPQQKIKHIILAEAIGHGYYAPPSVGITTDNIDDLYEEANELTDLSDFITELREGEADTGLPTRNSSHYEATAVAAKAPDGSWVGWTYWYGGGKHGCPEEIKWMEYAYDLACTEKEKLVVVRTFTRVDKKEADVNQ